MSVILTVELRFLSTQNYNIPNNREWALVIWLSALLIWTLWDREGRSNILQLLRVALSPKLLIPLVLMLGYIALEVWLGAKASIWRSDLIKDTLVWVAVALALFIRSAETARQPHFFRTRIAAAFGITEFLAVFTNTVALSLIAEVLLWPVLVLLGGVSVLAEREAKYQNIRGPVKGLLALIGISLLTYSIWQTAAHWSEIDKGILLQQLALPVWLTIGLLPFIYFLSLFANYESAFLRIGWEAGSRRAGRRAKMALLTKFHLRARDTATFGGPWPERIVSASSFTAARQVVADFQRSQQEAERAEQEEQERLRRYAGSQETDPEG